MANENMRWIILGIAVLMIFSMYTNASVPKEAVADIEGKACAAASDCPCIGVYNTTKYPTSGLTETQAHTYGIGVGSCRETANTCDMTYCMDMQPVGTWLTEHPWTWLKTNPMYAVAILGLLLLVVFWPKH